ncbi:MAG: hypothetical protein LBO74_04055 [Candidatus Symbiothrix sp.]|nr:hypothetical protein [Candidatus Symbiothrix sp.]
MSDYEKLSESDEQKANKYFYNSWNSTGNQFVSFIYKSNKEYNIDIEKIKSFIYHYVFAQNLLEGFIKNIIPPTCILTIASLESEPFFNYISHFIREIDDPKEIKSFSKRYFEINKRNFDFDCYYHNTLTEAAVQTLNAKESITDKELHEAGGGDIADLRRFVVEEKIPFFIGYHSTRIDEIKIDASLLKEKMKDYIPKNAYVDIHPRAILKLIEKQEKEKLEKQEKLARKCENAGIKAGDYICCKGSYNDSKPYIGIVKNISDRYNTNLQLEYIVLKNDLSESRLPLRETQDTNILYILKNEVFEEHKKNGTLKTKDQLMQIFKKEGKKNSADWSS